MNYPPTIIIRHTRENLKKCSLRGLENKADFRFFTYPDCALGKQTIGPLEGYLVLDVEGEPISPADYSLGLILIDATWRLADKMNANTSALQGCLRRSIPSGFQTAYPRRQDDCPDPEAGLASIEALYISYLLMGRSIVGLLDTYYWKEQFLEKNRSILLHFSQLNPII